MRFISFAVAALLAGPAFAQLKKPVSLAPLSLPTMASSNLTLSSLRLAPVTQSSAKTAGAVCLASCTLPVKWLRFSGERKNEQLCLLEWQTTNEVNNIGFDVERSFGNTTNFVRTGFVPASQHADAVLQYHFTDANDYAGITYYRLRQVDANNQFSYSKTISVKGYSRAPGLVVYPNPAQDQVTISATSTAAGTAHFVIRDAIGKLVRQRRAAIQKGTSHFDWEVSTLSKGAYLLQADMPDGTTVSVMFVKK